MRGSEATEPEQAERVRGGGSLLGVCQGGHSGCPPSHSEPFLHFDVVNGAFWCICPGISTYSTNLYLILLWKWLARRQLHMHTRKFMFLFSLSCTPFFLVAFFFGGGQPRQGPGSSGP